jgi:hypothetical protein
MYKDIIEGGGRPDARFQFGGSADSCYPTAVNERDAVAEFVDFVHMMRRHDHRSVEPVSQVEHTLPYCLARPRIETHCGLIEEQYSWAMQ